MTEVCPLCGRELGTVRISAHHLIPRLKGGKETVVMHNICHSKIHSLFSESQLQQWYHTVERLQSDPDMQSFIKWVRKRPIDFDDSSKRSNKHPRKHNRK